MTTEIKCNNLAPISQTDGSKKKNKQICSCYSKNSNDSRCCGICYKLCPNKDINTRCNCCPNNLTEYYKSGMVYTNSGEVVDRGEIGPCCVLCFPLKFAFFFPCFFGSGFNSCINYCRNTNTNYLF